MKLLTVLSLIMALSLSFTVKEEVGNGNKFVQFVAPKVDTQAEAMKISQFMNKQAGVLMARMDPMSKKFLIIFSDDFNYDETYFTAKFDELVGAEIQCYREGQHGVDKVIDQKLDCQ